MPFTASFRQENRCESVAAAQRDRTIRFSLVELSCVIYYCTKNILYTFSRPADLWPRAKRPWEHTSLCAWPWDAQVDIGREVRQPAAANRGHPEVGGSRVIPPNVTDNKPHCCFYSLLLFFTLSPSFSLVSPLLFTILRLDRKMKRRPVKFGFSPGFSSDSGGIFAGYSVA